jgi:ABC-type multidrug transport system permease subunit
MYGAIITGFVALALGLYVGRLWAPTPSWSLLIGLMCGGVCAMGYFGVTVLFGQLAPGALSAKTIGYWFFILIFAAPLVGALGSFLGYRRSPEFQQD